MKNIAQTSQQKDCKINICIYTRKLNKKKDDLA